MWKICLWILGLKKCLIYVLLRGLLLQILRWSSSCILLQVSDDEDDTHPNIDTPSLFRWRHQARVERMEEAKKERELMDAKLSQ